MFHLFFAFLTPNSWQALISLLTSLTSQTFSSCHIVGILQYVAFLHLLLSRSDMKLRYLCLIMTLYFFFQCQIILHCLDVLYFICPLTEGHVHFFPVSAIVNKTAKNNVCRFLCEHKFPKLWINIQEEPNYWVIWYQYVQFSKKPPNCLSKELYVAFALVLNQSFCCSTSLSAFLIVNVLNLGHSNRCVVESHCYFNLCFPGDIWYGASFHMFICHLYIFFVETSLKAFKPFSVGLVFFFFNVFFVYGLLSDGSLRIFPFSQWLIFSFSGYGLLQSRNFQF